MESYERWGLTPVVGEKVFVLTGRTFNPKKKSRSGFTALITRDLGGIGEKFIVKRKVPNHLAHLFQDGTTSEIHPIHKMGVLDENKERLKEISQLRLEEQKREQAILA
jgi:hypothetical protein